MSKIYAELAIYGNDLDPASITDVLGLLPSKTWLRGDPKSIRTGTTHDQGCWKLNTLESSRPLEDHLTVLMVQLANCKNSIRTLGSLGNSAVEISVVVRIDDEIPDISLSKSAIKWISEIGAALDIDMYFL